VLVIGAVVVIGGFAAADAIRGEPAPRPADDDDAHCPGQTTPRTPPRARSHSRRRPWAGPRACSRASLTFAGRRRPATSARSDWPAGASGRSPTSAATAPCGLRRGLPLAYGLGASSAGRSPAFPHRRPRGAQPGARRLYRALFGVVIWSQDAQRVACGADEAASASTSRSAAHRGGCPGAQPTYTRDDASRTRSETRSSSAIRRSCARRRRHHVRDVRLRRGRLPS
jgi:hypothetical protein